VGGKKRENLRSSGSKRANGRKVWEKIHRGANTRLVKEGAEVGGGEKEKKKN